MMYNLPLLQPATDVALAEDSLWKMARFIQKAMILLPNSIC